MHPINLLEKTNNIKKNKCSITISEKDDGYLSICQVGCVSNKRKRNWTHLFSSVYGGYAMLRAKYLIDLPGKYFIVYQINEHSKGAHTEYEVQLMDIRGRVIHQFSSRFRIVFMLDNIFLWFLKSEKKRFDYSNDIGLDLININIKTGKIDQSINLNYPKLLACPYTMVIDAKLTNKRNKNVLKIVYTDKLNNRHSKHILLSSNIFTDVLD